MKQIVKNSFELRALVLWSFDILVSKNQKSGPFCLFLMPTPAQGHLKPTFRNEIFLAFWSKEALPSRNRLGYCHNTGFVSLRGSEKFYGLSYVSWHLLPEGKEALCKHASPRRCRRRLGQISSRSQTAKVWLWRFYFGDYFNRSIGDVPYYIGARQNKPKDPRDFRFQIKSFS